MAYRYLFFIFMASKLNLGIAQAILSDSTLDIKEIIVSAARMAQSRGEVNMPVQVISGAQLISNSSRNLVEALQHEGVWMQKTNHGGGSPFIRGLTGNQVLVIKDGIRINNSIYRYGPNQYLSLQSIYDQEQIEIIRGSGAVQYGSDAIAGVINLISSKPVIGHKNISYGGVLTQWASRGTEKILNAHAGFSKKNYGISIRTSFLDFGDLPGGKNSGIQKPSGYREQNGDLKGRWMTRTGTWDLAYSFAKQFDVPVYHRIVLEGFKVNQSDQLSHQLAFLRNKFELPGTSFINQIETTLSWQALNEQRSLQKKSTDPVRLEKDGVQVLGLSSQIVFTPFSSGRSALGFDTYLDRVGSEASVETNAGNPSVLRGLYPDGARFLNAGIFNFWEVEVKRWNFSWGWRWNYYRLKTIDPNLGKVILKPSALVWNAAVGRSFGIHRLFLTVDKTFRAPNIDDAGTLGVVDFRYEIPNYDLKPEKGLHLSIGYRNSGTKVHMEHSLYYLQLHDLITRTAIKGDSLQGYPVFIKKNSDQSYIYGLESLWSWNINTCWSLDARMQYALGQNQTAREPIRRIPPLFYSGKLRYRPDKYWTIFLESVNAGEQNRLSAGDLSDNRISKTGTPSWNVLNAGLAFQHAVFAGRAGIENIFNRDYRVHGSGINGAGRLLRVSVQFTW